MRRGRTDLSGGRRLGWAEWGPEDGRPVLFCPGAGTSASLPFGEEAAMRLGLRVIAIDRPGLGLSDPRPQRTLDDWADDVGELVERRGLGGARIVGFSQGAPFALACAARAVVSACAVVAPTDELAAPHLRAHLTADVRAMVDRCADDPAEAEAWFAGVTPAMLHHLVLTSSAEVDRAVYADAAFDAAYRRALEEGFSQGPEGYARDAVLATSRWPFDPARIDVRVDVWCGSLDASPVHSPDLGKSLAARMKLARRTVVAGAGAAILWTHAEAILSALVEA